jgi:hypothetical protein
MARGWAYPKWFKCIYGVIMDTGKNVTMGVGVSDGNRLWDGSTTAPIAVENCIVDRLEARGEHVFRHYDVSDGSDCRHAIERLNGTTWDERKRTFYICDIRVAEW